MVLDQPYPPDIRVENEASTLVDNGYEVTILSIGPDDRPREEALQGVNIIRKRIPLQFRNKLRGFEGTVPAYTYFLSHVIRDVHRHLAFDFIHVHDLYLFGGGLRAARSLGVPMVGDLHENWVEALKRYKWSTTAPGKWVVSIPRWRKLERKWVNSADAIVVVIDEARDRNLELGVRPDQVFVVPNTVKISDFDRHDDDPTVANELDMPVKFVYTGGFDLHRGLESLVRSMPIVLEQRPDAHLVLVGDGANRADLERLVAECRVGSNVHFFGWQPQSRLPSFIRNCDIGVVPHLKTPHTDATIPHKLFHYMHMGKPVVVSDCTPLERIVVAERCGTVYEAGNETSLAGALLTTLRGVEANAGDGERGKEAVRLRYNWDATVGPLLDLYRGLKRP